MPHSYIGVRYGTTRPEVLRAILRQQGRCAVCGEPSKYKRLNIDHCHRRRRFRGLLCNRCNVAMGVVDNSELLEALVAYKAEFEEKMGKEGK